MLHQLTAAAPDVSAFRVRLAEQLEEEGELFESLAVWKEVHSLVPNSGPAAAAIDRLETFFAGIEPEEIVGIEVEGEISASGTTVDRDLDDLISVLEKGFPRSEGDSESPPSLAATDERDDVIVTETLAHIFEAQGKFGEASKIYGLLADQTSDPHQAAMFKARSHDLRKKDNRTGA